MDLFTYDSFHKSNLLIEQHFHGAFGIDFSTCESKDVLFLAKKLLRHGIGGFYPTLVTDSVKNIKRQIKRIKSARNEQLKQKKSDMSEILGIHIEGIFINPAKKGIHDETLFLKPTVKNYQRIEDDFIKIVTLAPELDKKGELRKYLTQKEVKVQAGHCVGGDLSECSGATHLFNAMSGITHRESSTALSALMDNNICTEIIADGIHLSDDILDLVFKLKPEDKVLLVSDSLPIAKSKLKEMMFAGQQVYYKNKKAMSKDGTIAGSTAVLDEIVTRLALKDKKNFEKYVKMASDNLYKYHGVEINGCIYWDSSFNIVAIEKDDTILYKKQ